MLREKRKRIGKETENNHEQRNFYHIGRPGRRRKNNVSRTVTANYIDDSRYNSLTRYFMITFSYKFNTFGKGNQPKDRNADEHRRGPGGPPPGGPRGGGRPPM